MFYFPQQQKIKILSQEQNCYQCNRWFKLNPKQLKRLEQLSNIRNKAKCYVGVPIEGILCTHCGTDNILLLPGKYDKPGTAKKKCACQFTVLAASKPTVKVKTKKFILRPYTLKHKGKRLTIQVRYNLDGTLPWQPVKIGTRWYQLRANGVSSKSYRSEAACQQGVDVAVALYSSLTM